jgi:D-glycero-D-manno-heptose 1,7-bisphosphate phosphatase
MNYTTVFLDRDGVINADSPDYIKSLAEFHLLPGSMDGIARLTRNGFDIIVITNQSVINRQMVSPAELAAIHDRLHQAAAAAGGRITDIFHCPHRPDEECGCRKPKPGLILAARQRYGIDLARSVMMGDSAKDILAGKAAGCGRTILVESGFRRTALPWLKANGHLPDHVAADLDRAANWIVAHLT